MRPGVSASPQRILIVSTTAIGDTVMATPFIRAVRERYPTAHITMMAHHRRQDVLEGNPHIDDFLRYHGKWKRIPSTLWRLSRAGFDMAVVLHANDPDIVPLVWWTGARIRVGWGESLWNRLFTHTILRTDPPEHFLIHKRRLLESVGIPVRSLETEMFFNDVDESPYLRFKSWLKERGYLNGFIGCHPFGSKKEKWWPMDRFLRFSESVCRNEGKPTVFLGDPSSLKGVTSNPHYKPDVHYTLDCVTLRQSAYFLKHAAGMITTDSGPMHLSFAVKCPTLCLFGPTDPKVHGPCFDQQLHRIIRKQPLDNLTLEEVQDCWDLLKQREWAE